MATAIRTRDAVAQATPNVATRHAGYLFHPVIDFMLAGGGSMLLALPIILLIQDKKAIEATALAWGFALSNVVHAGLPSIERVTVAGRARRPRRGSSGTQEQYFVYELHVDKATALPSLTA